MKRNVFTHYCPDCGEKLTQQEFVCIDAVEDVALFKFVYSCENCHSAYSVVEEMKSVAAPALKRVR